jgi:transposase, IS5 family
MRVTRVAQASIFECYSKHEFGVRLKELSSILDDNPDLLVLVAKDLVKDSDKCLGRTGFSAETIFRCLILKQQMQVSYEQLAFHLSDSTSYRTFARLPLGVYPSRSGLQSTIRKITPATLENVHTRMMQSWLKDGTVSIDQLRIDSTVVESNIAPPSDSQLLEDGVRVLSRLLAKSRSLTGIKIRFTDQRKAAKSLSFKIFLAKKAIKEGLYPELLKIVGVTQKQVVRGLMMVKATAANTEKCAKWITDVEHYEQLLKRVVNQTKRRVLHGEEVPSSEKLFSLFEHHTNIIVKGARDIQYGHKINLSSEVKGFITHLSIEDGNPADSNLYLPVIHFHQTAFNTVPHSTVADGCYASNGNIADAKVLGVKRTVFSKTGNHSLSQMGVKKKTFDKLRNFRAGVEGNISELKRAFGASRATWKGLDGFKSFVWSSVLCYNLVRLSRLNTG